MFFVKDMLATFPLGHDMWNNFAMLCDQQADQNIIQIARRDLDCSITMWLLTNEVALPGM